MYTIISIICQAKEHIILYICIALYNIMQHKQYIYIIVITYQANEKGKFLVHFSLITFLRHIADAVLVPISEVTGT